MKSTRIMVMDDDRMIREVISAQLHTLGHEPVLTKNGEEAINKYQAMQDEKKPVDIIIMDLTIPGGMGGMEAVRKLLVIDPLAKVIVASGYSNDPVMADYKKYGFSAAIGKPFSLDELAKVIESVLG
jgi:CheY-like chemotaxis protein